MFTFTYAHSNRARVCVGKLQGSGRTLGHAPSVWTKSACGAVRQAPLSVKSESPLLPSADKYDRDYED